MPRLFLECHRERPDSLRTVAAFARLGVSLVGENQEDVWAARGCDAILCGSFPMYGHALRAHELTGLPVIHYCWDLYPFQLNDTEVSSPGGGAAPAVRPTTNATRWREYAGWLGDALDVWVPSRCTADRVREFTGRESAVIRSPVYLWGPPPGGPYPGLPPAGTYVVDVMRWYKGDPNMRAVGAACKDVGVPCVEMNHRLPWDEFRRCVGNAALLVSATYEASTGGLTLLEGYAHGVPCLLSDSPRHGGRDYLGNRADYFKWDSPADLRDKIFFLYHDRRPIDAAAARAWVETEYSDDRFARECVARLRGVLP
jgi:hypothetical protein